MIRPPIVSGQFYEDDPIKLKKQIEDCFMSNFGPRPITENKNIEEKEDKKETKNNSLIGVISPHAGYMFSGPAQAFAYNEIAKHDLPDTFIILGISHAGYPSCTSKQDWKTPLGIIKTDIEFQEKLNKISGIETDETAHSIEHSIEVQLPFLQYITSISKNKQKNDKKEIKIAPIIVSSDIDYKNIADLLFKTIKETKRKVMIIASSDFTHYGPNYDYIPFRGKIDDIKKNLYDLDKGAMNRIESLQPSKFLDYTRQTGATICGKYPIAVLLKLSKKLGATKGKLLTYYTSGDILNDYSNAVGYAAIKIK